MCSVGLARGPVFAPLCLERERERGEEGGIEDWSGAARRVEEEKRGRDIEQLMGFEARA